MTPLSDVQSRNDPWPRFAAGTLPPSIRLEHKPWKGRVDMTFKGLAYDGLRARLRAQASRLFPPHELAQSIFEMLPQEGVVL